MKKNLKKWMALFMGMVLLFMGSVTGMPERIHAEETEQEPDGLYGTEISQENQELQIKRMYHADLDSMGDKDSWTIFVYMSACDLESEGGGQASADLSEMCNAEIGSGVKVVIQTGGCKEWKTEGIPNDELGRYLLEENQLTCLGTMEQASMGSWDTLYNFLSWGIENYPADHMGVIFWNHGGGSLYGVCSDENYDGDNLSMFEIDYALASLFDEMKDLFEFIGFDACLMGTLETANTMTPYARYMLASEEIEPGTGWYYTDFLTYLAQNLEEEDVVEEFGKLVCDSYIEESNDKDTTLSFFDLSKTDNVIKTTNEAFRILGKKCSKREFVRAARQADKYGVDSNKKTCFNLVDLVDLFDHIPNESGDAEIEQAKNDVKEAVKDFLYFQHGGNRVNSNGVSIYYPLLPEAEDMKTFAKLCPMPQYYGILDAIWNKQGDVSENWMEEIFGKDTTNVNRLLVERSGQYKPEMFETNVGKYEQLKEGILGAESVHIDSNGYLTARFHSLDEIAFAQGALYQELPDGEMIYLGETGDVVYDEENHTIRDDFMAEWPGVNGVYLPLTLSFASDKAYVYSCPAKINGGEPVNLRIERAWGHRN